MLYHIAGHQTSRDDPKRGHAPFGVTNFFKPDWKADSPSWPTGGVALVTLEGDSGTAIWENSCDEIDEQAGTRRGAAALSTDTAGRIPRRIFRLRRRRRRNPLPIPRIWLDGASEPGRGRTLRDSVEIGNHQSAGFGRHGKRRDQPHHGCSRPPDLRRSHGEGLFGR